MAVKYFFTMLITIAIISIVISVVMFFLPYYECRYVNSFSLSGLVYNLKKGGEALIYELLMLAAVLGIFFVAYLILGELGDSYPGCVYVPLFVILWVLIRGLYLPIAFVKNFGCIWKPVLFIFICFGIYKAVIWWISDMMMEANSIIAALVFGALLVGFATFMGRVAYGLVACACEK